MKQGKCIFSEDHGEYYLYIILSVAPTFIGIIDFDRHNNTPHKTINVLSKEHWIHFLKIYFVLNKKRNMYTGIFDNFINPYIFLLKFLLCIVYSIFSCYFGMFHLVLEKGIKRIITIWSPFKNALANRTTKGSKSERAATLNPITRKFRSQSVTH